MNVDPISWKLVKNVNHSDLVTLMYHAVSPGSTCPDWPWAVSYQAFCEQMDLLKALGWHTVLSHDVANLSKLPQNSVLITFDDGYSNTFSAFNALVERGMKASWFIVSSVIGGKPSWDDRSGQQLELLTKSQLGEIATAGMEIGSHSVTHCRLPEVDDKKLSFELSDSRKHLSDMIGRPVRTLAYPYGYYDARVLVAAQKTGYEIGFSTTGGFGLEGNDIMRVRRITVSNCDNLSTFARKLAFGLNDVSWDAIRLYALDCVKCRIKNLYAHVTEKSR